MKQKSKLLNFETEFIKKIPEHWERIPLKYVYDIRKGKLPSKVLDYQTEDSFPYLSMGFLRGNTEPNYVLKDDGILVNENDVLILYDGANAGEILRGKKGILSSTISIFKPINRKFNLDYFFYLMKFFEKDIQGKTEGMGIPHVDGNYLRNIKLILPSKTEQTKISSYLNDELLKIDSHICKNENLIKLLKEKQQTIINQTITTGLDKNTIKKDSNIEWIQDIPEHWKISKFLKILSRKKIRNDDQNDRSMLTLSQYLGIVITEYQYDNQEKTKEDTFKYFVVKPGDLVVNVMWLQYRAIGVSSYEGIVSPDYHVYEIDSSDMDLEYLNYLVRSDVYLNEYPKHLRGIRPNSSRIPEYDFLRLPLILPPKKEQENIVKFLNSELTKIIDLIIKIEELLKTFREYRQVLISISVIEISRRSITSQ